MAAVEDQQRGGESAGERTWISTDGAGAMSPKCIGLAPACAEPSVVATLPGGTVSGACWATQQSGCAIDVDERQPCVVSWQQEWQAVPASQKNAGNPAQRTAIATNIGPHFLPTLIVYAGVSSCHPASRVCRRTLSDRNHRLRKPRKVSPARYVQALLSGPYDSRNSVPARAAESSVKSDPNANSFGNPHCGL